MNLQLLNYLGIQTTLCSEKRTDGVLYRILYNSFHIHSDDSLSDFWYQYATLQIN